MTMTTAVKSDIAQYASMWGQVKNEMLNALVTYGPKILVALIAFIVLHRLAKILLTRLEKEMQRAVASKSDLPSESEKRVKTLFGVFRKAAVIVIWTVATLVILNTLSIQIGPIIAAAGVFGLAVSFGAQSLVKDIISGTFILFENQIRIGDVATINGTGGVVEQINLRTVVLRDITGTVHVFPNGNISTLANLTKDWSAAVLNIGVAYKENTDQVCDILRKVATELREDEVHKNSIIADLEIFGVDDFADSAVMIKCRFKTKPIEQWKAAREFRRRVKYAFDAAGIEIPFPHQTLYFGNQNLVDGAGRLLDAASGAPQVAREKRKPEEFPPVKLPDAPG
ncbi:hypothetical protein BH09SUM1_BH09SUM1_11550 [soil metagenome]